MAHIARESFLKKFIKPDNIITSEITSKVLSFLFGKIKYFLAVYR